MAQIPMMAQMAGGGAQVATPAEGDTGLFSLTAEGMVIGIPFDQTLQQLLTLQDTESAEGAVLLFAMQQPSVDAEVPVIPSTFLSKEGSLLPVSLPPDGKALPLMTDQPLPVAATEQQTSLPPLPVKTLQAAQPDLIMPRLISGEKPLNLTAFSTGEDGKLLFETVRGTDPVAQPTLSTLQQVPNSGVAGRSPLVLPLNVPVGQPGWDQAVGERIQWMVNQNVQQAEIKLTPPNLGPMEIKISMQNDQTSVTFVAAQAPTRDALEASIPRLREMFGEINLNLANVDVGHRQAGESGGDGAGEAQGAGASGDQGQADSGWSAESGPVSTLTGNGLLDTYA